MTKKTVLVVDDFEVNTYAVGHTLKMAGYNVLKATSGKEALQVMQDSKVDLVITDYKMPEMDGVELIQHIRRLPQYRFIPVLVLSTETSEEKKKLAYDVGITGWIHKPFVIDKFLATVKKALS